MKDKYLEPEFLESVKEFNKLTENLWQEEVRFPSAEVMDLRAHLITEECLEFEKAIKDRKMVDIADALIDILYVTFGAIGAFGMGDLTKEMFEEVHRSNMSKLCENEDEAIETVQWYANTDNHDRCEAGYKKLGDKYMVFRKSDGKTLKSINYKPADLLAIIEVAVNGKGDE